jgi:hypothetical protein
MLRLKHKLRLRLDLSLMLKLRLRFRCARCSYDARLWNFASRPCLGHAPEWFANPCHNRFFTDPNLVFNLLYL